MAIRWDKLTVKAQEAMQRANDLDRVAGIQGRVVPDGASHHRAVDRDGEKSRAGIDAARGEKLGDRRCRDLLVDAVDLEPGHCAASAGAGLNRLGANGTALSGRMPLSTYALTTAAVTGVSRMPLR